MTAAGAILTLNIGSSGLKFALFDPADTTDAKVRGAVELGDDGAHFFARSAACVVLADRRWTVAERPPVGVVLDAVLAVAVESAGVGGLAAVGHRLVLGGPDHAAPEVVTPALLTALEAATALDPLHMPSAVAAIVAIQAAQPQLVQVACFDTAFHRTLAPVATRLALPSAIAAKGVRKYGFHGLSYAFVAERLRTAHPALAAGRVVAAHLGSGASLCAMANGLSVETTTGFSALEGLVMATRCGSLDPGAILYLARQGHSFADIEDMLYRRSGLLGLSGISGDVRILLESEEPAAADAMESFVYRIAIDAAAMVGALGGLDGLVFTAGIGEHCSAVRAAVCARLAWLGVRLDAASNAAHAPCISADDSKVQVLVIPANEEATIARHTLELLKALERLKAAARC
jgi:acetate kinase